MEMSNNTIKHEVLIKQHLHSILDISTFLTYDFVETLLVCLFRQHLKLVCVLFAK